MAKIKYFSGDVELIRVSSVSNAEFSAKFPGAIGRKNDGYSKLVGWSAESLELPVDRVIEYKSNPSRHECDARCVNATGKIMKCECSCGGKNHGKRAFATTGKFYADAA